jgi:succinate dehydrogenase / fumarate reductase cytochrome b subunit
MTELTRKPTIRNVASWFDFRGRSAGTFAFVLNRVTALGLTFYLYLHLIVLGSLAQGPEAYDSFLETIKSPVFILGELLVVAAGIIHGLNGIRVALTRFYALLALGLVATAIFGVRMFTA